MDPTTRPTATAPLTLLVSLLVVAFAAAMLTGVTPAHASSNHGQDGCLMGYNYADPANDFLFASSDGLASDCAWVSVGIHSGGFAPPPDSFSYSCSGDWLAGADGTYYAATSVVKQYRTWWNACSTHMGAPQPYSFHRLGSLAFIY